jgi:hypothetical protein
MAPVITPARAAPGSQAQPGQAVVSPSVQALLAAARRATPSPSARLHRRAGPVPAPLYGHTGQGNSAVISDARGQPAAQPGKGAGTGIANAYPYPSRLVLTTPSQLLRRARTTMFQHTAAMRDRRVTGNRGMVTLSGLPDTKPGFPDWDAAGPARPSYKQINRTLSWQIGTDSTANLDNTAAKPMTTAGNRAFSLGTRGDPWTTVWGGTRNLALWRPYGKRGGPGPGAPQPRVKALPGGPYRAGTVLSAGAPGDGPQKIASGPAWGLHSQTAEPAATIQQAQRYRATQVRPGHAVRPQNSANAGQSMSQAAVSLDGSVPVKIPRLAPGRQPGLNAAYRRTT